LLAAIREKMNSEKRAKKIKLQCLLWYCEKETNLVFDEWRLALQERLCWGHNITLAGYCFFKQLVIFEVSRFLRVFAIAGRTIISDQNIILTFLCINHRKTEMEVGLLLFRRRADWQISLHIGLILLDIRYHWKSFMPDIRMLLFLEHVKWRVSKQSTEWHSPESWFEKHKCMLVTPKPSR
jgi:hypothetical protein